LPLFQGGTKLKNKNARIKINLFNSTFQILLFPAKICNSTVIEPCKDKIFVSHGFIPYFLIVKRRWKYWFRQMLNIIN